MATLALKRLFSSSLSSSLRLVSQPLIRQFCTSDSSSGETEESDDDTSEKPPEGVIKFSLSTSVDPVEKRAGVGGLFSDHNGDHKLSFMMNCGDVDALEAGLMGFEKGLLLAEEYKFEKLIFESNLKELIDLFDEIKLKESRAEEVEEEPEEGWKASPVGFIKINVGTNVDPVKKCAGAGVIFRNHKGEVVDGFSMECGDVDIVEAGLRGIKKALLVAMEKKFEKVIIETDIKELLGFTPGYLNMMR